MCLKLLLVKDQGRDWFDIKSTAESGALAQTHTADYTSLLHVYTHIHSKKYNYAHAAAESNTIKISDGACSEETCHFS